MTDTLVDELTLTQNEYSLLPLRNTVLFPQQIIPVYIGREHSLQLIEDLGKPEGKKIVLVAQREGSVENPEPKDLYEWGTLAVVLKVFNMPDKQKSAIMQGIRRVKINDYKQSKPYFKVEVDEIEDQLTPSIELEAHLQSLVRSFKNIVDIAPYLSDDQLKQVETVTDPGRMADRSISLINISTAEKQKVLEVLNVKDRAELASTLIGREIQRLKLSDKIQTEVQDEISKTQREYFLREQMKAIRKELGEDETSIDTNEFHERIKKAKMSEEAEKAAKKEIEKLNRIPSHSPEHSISRTYIDWLLDMPWAVDSKDNQDITRAKEVLDEDHYGLKKIKERIIEHLAVRILKMQRADGNEKQKSPILCLGGPPGTGKTSVGKSIARAMGREFVRMSLGGVHDEAEIRGHRRTYIGALPGRIITNLKKAGTNNPVFMLDEVDKIGKDFRGDPASALLEVLDPEQNFAFNDHYLEVDFDLSRVFFITTANMIDQIPGPLRDRMELLEFSGYILSEKVAIAKGYLIPKQLKEHGLKASELQFEDEAIAAIVQDYTREAGVRNLERQFGHVCRKVATEVLQKELDSVTVDKNAVHKYLGPIKYFNEVAQRALKPGVVIGLAWTAFGGDILFIEASKMAGKGGLKLTGQLGEVMKESAEAALSFVRSSAKELGIDEQVFEKTDIHIHVPAGAIPKDGPSAGVAMVTAITSVLSGKSMKDRLGMTGEISLRGNVMPIGGLREKATAAHRTGLKEIIVPEHNRKDLEDIPENVLKDLKISFVNNIHDLLKSALESK